MNRLCSNALPQIALTKNEMMILDTFVKKGDSFSKAETLSQYLIQIARLGGYLARASDPPPGNSVIWKGMSRLMDIELGFKIALKVVGN